MSAFAAPVTLAGRSLVIGATSSSFTRPEQSAVRHEASSHSVAPRMAVAGRAKKLPKFYNPSTASAQYQSKAAGQNATPYDVRLNPTFAVPGNARENANGSFRNMDPYTDDLVWARPEWSSDEARAAVNVVLRNVLGNAHILEEELDALSDPISCVTKTADMREFVRAVALSPSYRKRFFEPCSTVRFIELNFLHLRGRAPHSQAEISEHVQIVNEQGYNAEINAHVDSPEYDELFGNSRVPAPNFRGGHNYNADMNKLAVLKGPFSRSDATITSAIMPTGNSSSFTAFAIKRGLPEAWSGENKGRDLAGPVSSFSPDVFWNPQPAGLREAEVAWTMRYGSWNKFWYKDSIVYKEVMSPNRSETDEAVAEADAILKYGSLMAKNYIGVRKTFDVAPVIEITPPAAADIYNGVVSLKMEEISFSIPSELTQSV